MRKKKLRHLLHQRHYRIAIDGTQKHTMDKCHDERYLRRQVSEGKYQYYVYVLEAVLIFSNGMVLGMGSIDCIAPEDFCIRHYDATGSISKCSLDYLLNLTEVGSSCCTILALLTTLFVDKMLVKESSKEGED